MLCPLLQIVIVLASRTLTRQWGLLHIRGLELQSQVILKIGVTCVVHATVLRHWGCHCGIAIRFLAKCHGDVLLGLTGNKRDDRF